MKKILGALFILFFCSGAVYAINLDGVKGHFLKSEWKDAIREGETLLAGSGRDSSDLDQLYYYLGMSYFKEGEYLRSADIFDIILKEFPKSSFAEQALRASIESYSSARDYGSAIDKCQLFLKKYPKSPSVTEVCRLVIINRQKMDKQNAAGASATAPQSSEMDPDLVLAKDLIEGRVKIPDTQSFWVQVGAFSSDSNADKLASKLRAVSYTAIVAHAVSKGKSVFKVRVGPYHSKEEAQAESKKLSLQGYPTKVIP
jgi:tetratricopeptide (TPR) repeat protein